MRRLITILVLLCPLFACSQSGIVSGGLAAVSGEFVVEPPTLLSLGFEWKITGDDNRNARVDVSYRKAGETAWRDGLPMFRLNGESVTGGAPRDGDGTFYSYTAPNMFAGSILNLEPDTEYECRFTLSDPDGVKGETVRVVSARTRKEPEAAAGGRVYHVYPFGYDGPRQEPAYTGLLAAYYTGSDHSDHSNAFQPRVEPGDIILVHAGVYKDNRFTYSGFDRTIAAYGTPFDGTYYLTRSGTPDKPIVIRAAGDGEAVFDGDGCHNLFNVMAANYNYFEDITVRNTNVAFLVGLKNIAGASGFTLKRSRLENIGRGVQAEWSGSKNFYIADNVFIGRHDPDRLQTWWEAGVWSKFPDFPAPITSEYAVKVYGQGHVVAWNYVANWHDGIDIATYGNPDGTPDEIADRVPVAIDFHNNDFSNITDNCIEADGGARNIRVFNNRCLNSATGAFSAQPIFGGPLYIYRNLAYNTASGGPLKFVDTPAGVLVYQNTFIGQGALMGPASNVHFRNNLILGDGWADPVLNLSTFTNYSTSDYNGFRPNENVENAFQWNSPPFETPVDYSGKLVARRFRSLEEYQAETKQEQNSILVDYDVFVNVRVPDKSDPQRLYRPEEVDFRLKPGSAAIDRGVILPSITDGFTGNAPDLGAFELDRTVPHYGPRFVPDR
jgi:hypothetical protein